MKFHIRSRFLACLSVAFVFCTELAAVAQYPYGQPGNLQAQAAYQAAALRQAVLRQQLLEELRRRQMAAQQAALQAAQMRAAQQAAIQVSQARAAQFLAARQQQAELQAAANRVLGAMATQQRSAPLFSGAESPQQMINRLNSMSAADVNALTNKPHWLDQFTPHWLKKAPGGNVLAQFGIGNGLMKELGSLDLRKILDPNRLDAIQSKLRQAEILGNVAAGQAAQNRVYNEVQKHQNVLLADKDRAEALKRLWEAIARTGLTAGLEGQ